MTRTPTLFAIAVSLSTMASIWPAPQAHASALEKLRAHRAVYDLSLKEASDRSGITGMNGRIVYEMQGSVCEGFTVRFRFLTRVQSARKTFTNDQRSSTFESGDGNEFSFVTQSFLNGQQEQDLRGRASKKDDKIKITISKPDEREVELDTAMYMTAHIAKLLDAAAAEQTIVQAKVFDGSDEGDKLVDTTAVIGRAKPSLEGLKGEPEELVKSLSKEEAWPMSVSYFSTGEEANAGERLPSYQVSFYLHASGVSRDLKMQYPDYALSGQLKELEYLPVSKCE